jgi:hypothetical protein
MSSLLRYCFSRSENPDLGRPAPGFELFAFPGPQVRGTWGIQYPVSFFEPGHREILEQFSIRRRSVETIRESGPSGKGLRPEEQFPRLDNVAGFCGIEVKQESL